MHFFLSRYISKCAFMILYMFTKFKFYPYFSSHSYSILSQWILFILINYFTSRTASLPNYRTSFYSKLFFDISTSSIPFQIIFFFKYSRNLLLIPFTNSSLSTGSYFFILRSFYCTILTNLNQLMRPYLSELLTTAFRILLNVYFFFVI